MNDQEIPFMGKCDFCNQPGEKATRDNLNGITFLWPDLRWICERCLRHKLPIVGTQ